MAMMSEKRELDIIHSSFASTSTSRRTLGEDLSEYGVVFTFVNMVYTNVSVRGLLADVRLRSRAIRTVGDYLVGDIYVADLGRTDTHSLGNCGLARGASFHFCA